MSKTYYEVVVRDSHEFKRYNRYAPSDIKLAKAEIERAFKEYEIIKITPIEVKNFSSTLINGSSIRG